MSNHLHLVAEAVNNAHLSDILRDFKKFSSYKIIETIKSGNESRQDWMLYRFAYAAKFDSKVTNYKFWQEGNEPKEVYSNDFMKQKIEYTHQNPVRAEIVAEPEHYLYSSASNYAGLPGLLEVELAY